MRTWRITLAAILGLAMAHAQAADIRTWDGGGGTTQWNTATNWSDDNIPDSATEAADTNSTANSTITYNTSGLTIDGLWVRAGDTLAINAGNSANAILTVATDLSNDGTLNINASTLNTNTRTRGMVYQGAAFTNNGTISLVAGSANARNADLALTGANGVHVNAGTIAIEGNSGANTAVAAVRVTGESAIFENRGTVELGDLKGAKFDAAGREYRQTAGTTTVGTAVDSLAQFTAGQININGGVLKGSGAVTGAVTVNDGAVLAPGASPGGLAINGALTLASGSTLQIELAGTGFEFNVLEQYDRVRASGLSTLAGDLSVSLMDGFALTGGEIFGIVDAAGGLSGQFANLAEGDTVLSAGGVDLKITYLGNVTDTTVDKTGGADVVLYAVPEPATMALLGLGGVTVLLRRRR